MQYSVCVSTDCEGEKVNLRFLFDERGPSVAQLLNRATIAFNKLFYNRGINRTFASCSAVIFNNTNCTWDRLEHSTQLLHNSQVYLFQSDIVDVPAEIQEPFEGYPLLGEDYVSPQRQSSTSPHAAAPAHYDPRPPFAYHSPHARYSTRRSMSGDRAHRNRCHDHIDDHHVHQHDVKGGHDVYLVDNGQRSPSYGLVRSEKSTSYRAMSKRVSSSSPTPSRGLDEYPYYGYRTSSRLGGDDSRSIIRDEREKIEQQFRMPLDEMRRSLKEETQEMKRSISPQRQVIY